jgi:hypothetical protein
MRYNVIAGELVLLKSLDKMPSRGIFLEMEGDQCSRLLLEVQWQRSVQRDSGAMVISDE